MTDHAELEQLARALRTSEARLRAVFDNLPFDLWMIGSDGRYVMQNDRSRDQWGDIVGKRPEDVTPDAETLALWQENNGRAFAGETVRGEVQLPRTGERRHYYNVIAPIAAEGRTLGIVGINLDITDRKQAEEALRRRNEELHDANCELERLSQSKDQLTAMISHELRTPLVTGLGYIEMLLDGKLGAVSSTAHSRLVIAQRNLRRLAQMIDGVLRYQRIMADSVDDATLRATSFDVGRLADELVQETAERPPELLVASDLPHVSGDRELIRMVLANLLDNARAHAGDAAAVRLTVRDDSRGVLVAVEDNGVGIPPAIRDSALDPFVRGDAHNGSGLGLAIVQAILKAHGSEVHLDSQKGEGTKIWFRLKHAMTP